MDDAVYIFGGVDANGTVLNQVLKYNPTLHTYTPMAPMPTPRYRMGATLLDSKFSEVVLSLSWPVGCGSSVLFVLLTSREADALWSI